MPADPENQVTFALSPIRYPVFRNNPTRLPRALMLWMSKILLMTGIQRCLSWLWDGVKSVTGIGELQSAAIKAFWFVFFATAWCVCIFETVGSVRLYFREEVETLVTQTPVDKLPNLTLCHRVAYKEEAYEVKNFSYGITASKASMFHTLLGYSPAEAVDRLHLLHSDETEFSPDYLDEFFKDSFCDASRNAQHVEFAKELQINSETHEQMFLDLTDDSNSYFKMWSEGQGFVDNVVSYGNRSRHAARDREMAGRFFQCYTTAPNNEAGMPVKEAFVMLGGKAYDSTFLYFNNGEEVMIMHGRTAELVNVYVQMFHYKRIQHCSPLSVYERKRMQFQEFNNIFYEHANCCICGNGLRCESIVPCCGADPGACSLSDRGVREKAFRNLYSKTFLRPCDETVFTTTTSREKNHIMLDVVGSLTQIYVIFQNVGHVTEVQERWKHDLGYIMGRVGGILGLMCGASVLALLQAILLRVEKGLKKITTVRRRVTVSKISGDGDA